MEEIIAKHPEIIENGLILKGRQVYVSGLRIDLLFEDKFGDRLIIELKKGTVTRNHVAQLMEYSGAIPESERSITRVMLVANIVPPRWKKALDIHGIEYRELTNLDYIEFLKEKDPKLLEELQKKQLQPVSPPERPKVHALITSIGQKLGILWSHNEQTYPTWLTTVAEVIKLQGFIWWIMGWKIRAEQFTFPVKGYICCKGKITHEALIDSIVPQPNKEVVKEVAENRQKCYKLGIPRPPYDEDLSPLNRYLNGEKKTLTLLKLIEIEELSRHLELIDIKLWKTGKAISRCPQGYHCIILQ